MHKTRPKLVLDETSSLSLTATPISTILRAIVSEWFSAVVECAKLITGCLGARNFFHSVVYEFARVKILCGISAGTEITSPDLRVPVSVYLR
jgi:hypothetical protein